MAAAPIKTYASASALEELAISATAGAHLSHSFALYLEIFSYFRIFKAVAIFSQGPYCDQECDQCLFGRKGSVPFFAGGAISTNILPGGLVLELDCRGVDGLLQEKSMGKSRN